AGFEQCYKIKAVSVSGQESWSNGVCATFENLPQFYNIITANQDGLNDAFVIGKLHLYPQNQLQIFNRWGVEVYRSENYQNNWQAANVSAGVYYYYFRANGKTWKGWMEVVK
ncbi:MAG TPA: gliding motility-associated C-terminal domain-containing protein, partial [Adhaeribacter sp.]|nr:gliding motility-associated C-terminal domain-containing protein [Adhaeribacter sp.]